MEAPTAFELEQWEKEAKRMVICTGCYGSGEDRWNDGRACDRCGGMGKAEGEPHTLQLIAEVRRLYREMEDRVMLAYRCGAIDARERIAEAMKSAYDSGTANAVLAVPMPEPRG